MKPDQTDSDLIAKAIDAVSSCNWTIGQCAADWCKRHERGRTSRDFADLIGLTADKTYACQRVWQRFGVSETFKKFPTLKWSHFHTVHNDEDAENSLEWSVENSASVAQLKAFRRMNRGDDLTEEPDPEADEVTPSKSRRPESSDTSDTLKPEPITAPAHDPAEVSKTTAAAAPAYSPYRADTLSVKPAASPAADVNEARQLLRKLTTNTRAAAQLSAGAFAAMFAEQLTRHAEALSENNTIEILDTETFEGFVHGIQKQ